MRHFRISRPFLETVLLPIAVSSVAPIAVVASKAVVLLLILAALGLIPTIVENRKEIPKLVRAWRIPAVFITAFLLWGMSSAMWSIDAATSVVKAVQLFGISLLGGIVIIGFRRIGASAQHRIAAGQVVGISVALFLLAGRFLWLAATVGTEPDSTGFNPLSALNPGLTVFAILIWPAAVVLVARSIWWLLAFLVATFVLLLTLSTSGATALALLTGSLVAGAAILRMKATGYAVAALLFVTLAAAPFMTPRPTTDAQIARTMQILPGSAQHRLYIWEFAAVHALQRPLLGWGLESSRSIPGGQKRPPVGYAYMPLHPHNAALQIWLELGAPGALLAAVFSALLALRCAGSCMARRFGARAAMLGSMAAFVTVAFTAYNAWQSWWVATAWLTAALLVALNHTVLASTPDAKRRPKILDGLVGATGHEP